MRIAYYRAIGGTGTIASLSGVRLTYQGGVRANRDTRDVVRFAGRYRKAPSAEDDFGVVLREDWEARLQQQELHADQSHSSDR